MLISSLVKKFEFIFCNYVLISTRGNHLSFGPSLLSYKWWLIFMGMKYFSFLFKMADSKKQIFKTANSQIFVSKISGIRPWVIDAKGIDVAQPILLGLSVIGSKTAFFEFLGCFWDYTGQPHDHIESHINVPLHQSILLNQGPIPEIFVKKFWELAILKCPVFLSWPFWKKI